MSNNVENASLSRARFIRVSVALACLTCASMFGLETLVWHKLLSELAMPLGVCWLLLSGIVLSAWIACHHRYFVVLAGVWSVFYIAGTSPLGDALVTSLESPFVELSPLDMERFDTLIVLGGATGRTPGGDAQLAGAGDRVGLAARMYHAGKVGKLIVTGSKIEGIPGGDPSLEAQELLTAMGVPSESIVAIGGRTTLEEMEQLKHVIVTGERAGLITSAWHLRRALRRAEAVQLDLIPVPSDFSTPTGPRSVLSWIPRHSGFDMTSKAWKEYLGMMVGR